VPTSPRLLSLASTWLIGVALLGYSGSGTASAAPDEPYTAVTIGPAGYGGNAIASGPDGSLWFTDNGSTSIGRITPTGSVKAYPVPTSSALSSGPGLFSLAAGPDGNMWFTEFYGNQVGRITPTGVITTFAVPAPAGASTGMAPYGITAGPDGNLWFTNDFANAVGRITPEGVITQFPVPSPDATGATSIVASTDCIMCGYLITAGPDNALWFTIPAANRIGRIDLAGVVTTYPVPTSATSSNATDPISLADITSAPDGSLWFTQPADNQIGRITTGGAITEFAIPRTTASPTMITPGPRGSAWFTASGTNALGRLASDGTFTQVTIPNAGAIPTDVVMDPSGRLRTTLVVETTPNDILQVASIGSGSGAILRSRVQGTTQQDAPLTCRVLNTSGWRITKTHYRWLRDGRIIPGRTSQTFTPGSKDLGGRISCAVSVTTSPMLTQYQITSPTRLITR